MNQLCRCFTVFKLIGQECCRWISKCLECSKYSLKIDFDNDNSLFHKQNKTLFKIPKYDDACPRIMWKTNEYAFHQHVKYFVKPFAKMLRKFGAFFAIQFWRSKFEQLTKSNVWPCVVFVKQQRFQRFVTFDANLFLVPAFCFCFETIFSTLFCVK